MITKEKWPLLVEAGVSAGQAKELAKRKAWMRSQLESHLANAMHFAVQVAALKNSVAAPLFSEDGVDYQAVAAELARIHAVVVREGR